MKCLTFALLVVVALSTPVLAQGRASQPVDANGPRIVVLALQPSRIDATRKHSLLPSAAVLKNGDAAVFYNRAVEALPDDSNAIVPREWVTMPLDKLPQNQVAELLRKVQPSLQLVAQGIPCRDCNWPDLAVMGPKLARYRELAFVLHVKARLEITQKRYDDALATLGSGLVLGKCVGEAPTIIQSLIGVAMAGTVLRSEGDLAQIPESPNLYTELRTLPIPLVDVEKSITNESKLHSDTSNREAESTFERARLVWHRMDGDIAARQCIEALRHYAATHGRQLPTNLSDISDLQLSNDPATGKPFVYHLEGAKAILEVSAPKGGTPRDGVRYEMTMAQ
jgi:hypothetical protein